MRRITAEKVKLRLTDGAEIAFLDVREHGQYGAGHPFFAVNLPYSRLEALAPRLMPRRSVPCVLMDDGDGVAEKAADRLAELGFTDLAILDGGAPAWAAAGFTLFDGVNLPSKTFGELVEHAMGTPSVSAEELHAMQQTGADLILLDGRTREEYRRMTVPGSRSCPNAELGYRLPGLGIGPKTRVVINCAGRTRSIIGAQTLRNLGVSNPVIALRNGTQGWELAGYRLARGNAPAALPDLSPDDRKAGRERAEALIERAGLVRIGRDDWDRLRAGASRSHYLLDVRTAEEYAAGHVPGAVHAPGGQLVQATDQWVAVRGALIVLSDDTGLRAATTALWLRGMGHDVALLDVDASDEPGALAEVAPDRGFATIAPGELPDALAAGAILLDASPSMDFRTAHIDRAVWTTRPRLDRMNLEKSRAVIIAARDPDVARALCRDLAASHEVTVLEGGPEQWRAAGLDVISTPGDPPDADCIDYVFHTHDRHSGNLAAAQAYLDWETGLIDRLDTQERGVFRPDLSLPG